MVKIVDAATNRVLTYYDAWDTGWMAKATLYMRENGLRPVRTEYTLLGNMIVFVERR